MIATITIAIAEPSPYSLVWNEVWYAYTAIDQYSGDGCSSRRIQIWLKTWKSQMVERLARMMKIGFSSGTVTSRKTRHAWAPSIEAASTSSLGTCVSAA